MNFAEDPGFKTHLIEALTAKYGKEREGIHVSDLVYCLREAYYRKTDPQPLSETDLMFFADGAERHGVLEGLSGLQSEVKIEYGGVQGTVDIVGDYPVEIKSTRSNKELPYHYFVQLGYYAAMLDSKVGILLVQRLNNREAPWECLRVEWSPDEIKAIRADLEERSMMLVAALVTKNPAPLPKCELPPDEKGQPWKCRYCAFTKSCAELEERKAKEAV